jgi:hypothetical protein
MGEHHHTHHHHKEDGASRFKHKSLAAIRKRKQMAKILKMALLVIAVLMGIVVLLAYTVG